MAGELEIVVTERALLPEEDEHEASAGVARRLDRHREKREVALRSGDPTEVGQQPLVVGDGGRDEDAPFGRCTEERPVMLRRPLLEDASELLRKLVRPDGLEAAARGDEHGGRAAPERLRGSLGDRLERGRAGERLTEHRGDPVEAALDPRLPSALGEHLGVAQRKRRESCERLEDARVPLLEAAARAPTDSEHAAHLVAPGHRSGHHVGESVVGRVRDRSGDLAVRALDQRCTFPHRCAGKTMADRELEAEQPRRETMDRDAAEDAALAIEEVAIRSIGVEELGELVGEPLEDHRQVELAAQHMRRPKQSGLLRELLLVLLQGLLEGDPGAKPLERDGRLRGERLHHLEVLAREDAGLVEGRDRDHSRHAVFDEQRDERRALCSDGRDEAGADRTRARGVVHRERCRLENRTRDPRRLAVEVEVHRPPPVDVLAARAREVARRLPRVVRDEA